MTSADALQDYWHPVATSTSVQDKPLGITLLNEPIALWRAKDGVMAVHDRCSHRGTKLSLGWVDNGELICPYHGWSFRGDGNVSTIPSLPLEREIPSKACIKSYNVMERYGLVFVCMGEPRQPIDDLPEFEEAGFKTHILGPFLWQTGAVRNFENFFDESHLPWVHPGALGNRQNVPLIPTREIKEGNNNFSFEYKSECQDRLDPSKITVNRLGYRIMPPFTLYHDHINPQGEKVADLFMVTPVTDTQSLRMMVVARNFGLDQPAEKFKQFTSTLWEQDRIICESQTPKQVRLGAPDDLPLRGPDTPLITYRKMLRELGPSPML